MMCGYKNASLDTAPSKETLGRINSLCGEKKQKKKEKNRAFSLSVEGVMGARGAHSRKQNHALTQKVRYVKKKKKGKQGVQCAHRGDYNLSELKTQCFICVAPEVQATDAISQNT